MYVPRRSGNNALTSGAGNLSNTSPTELAAASQTLTGLKKPAVALKNVKSAQNPSSSLGEVAAGVSLPAEQANSIEVAFVTSSASLIYSPSNKPIPSYKEVALAAPDTCLLVRQVNEVSTADKPQLEINESQQSTTATFTVETPGKENPGLHLSALESNASELQPKEKTETESQSAPQSDALETSSEKNLESESAQEDQRSSSSDSAKIVSKTLEDMNCCSEAVCDTEGETTELEPSLHDVPLQSDKSFADERCGLACDDISRSEELSELALRPQTPSSLSEASKKLSAAAPPFSPVATVARITTAGGTVAVTPFKDGKPPQSGGLSSRNVPVSLGQTAIAVTPIRKILQSSSALQSESSQTEEAGGDASQPTSPHSKVAEVENDSPPLSLPPPPAAPTPASAELDEDGSKVKTAACVFSFDQPDA